MGNTALAAYTTAAHDGSPFALVVLDLRNTLGPGGLLTLNVLRALDPQVKVIICSADHHDPVLCQYQDYGFCAALRKPVKLGEFRDTLRRFVSASGMPL